jgi:cytochrome c peroxidase
VGLRRALASFLRTLVSGGSAYDHWLDGDEGALDAAQRRGLDLFLGERGGCFHCHPPGSLTNQGFFNNGTASLDPGRQRVTGRTGDLGKFKVPGLRNVAASAPYMHDGSLGTLAEVIDQYDRGGRGAADPQIGPLHLTAAEKSDLEAFLNALSDESFLRDPRHRAP